MGGLAYREERTETNTQILEYKRETVLNIDLFHTFPDPWPSD